MRQRRFLDADRRIAKKRAKQMEGERGRIMALFMTGLDTCDIAERLCAPEASIVMLMEQFRETRRLRLSDGAIGELRE
jgi:hypothetical protein